MSETCIIIPARFKSSRFPGKPLVDLLGKSMIIRVLELACKVVNKKDESGFLGGVIGKLPKFLQTPARGIIEDLSRRSPIGRITGGRVFPPFKIPPIRL